MKQYQSPLVNRYARDEMLEIFSPHNKVKTWRRLWWSLAKNQKDQGLDITKDQVDELEANIDNIDFDLASKYESETHHDVMAHILTYGDCCPKARGIIHLGATSAYVVDNADLIIMRDALCLIWKNLAEVIKSLRIQAEKWHDTSILGYTHFQKAQLTTLGKRICMWLQDFEIDMHELSETIRYLPFLGAKGATGTQASFMKLFDGDSKKVKILDILIKEDFKFPYLIPISGQTYTRKIDTKVQFVLSSIAQSAHKFAVDMRLMQHMGEVNEPFGKKQVGSSAMVYKRNPMLAERITSLARTVFGGLQNALSVASNQWLERSLDDSASKRKTIPEAFLTVDAVLGFVNRIVDGMVVHEDTISRNVKKAVPLMITEDILMQISKDGIDRQDAHEELKKLALSAIDKGEEDQLVDRIMRNPYTREVSLDNIDAFSTGRAAEQVLEYLERSKEDVELP